MGSKSESCSQDTPSFSLKAPCDQLESHETPYRTSPALGQLAGDRLVQLQLVGADGAEGERVEDQHRAPALQVLLGEAAAVAAGQAEARRRGPWRR